MAQAQLAQLLSYSQRIYSNYERGDVKSPTQILIRLAGLHQTSVDCLLELTDERAPYKRAK